MADMALRLPALTPRRRRQLWYVPLLALAMALAMAKLLVFAHLLGVEQFGLFSVGFLVSSSFCMAGCFGLMPMLQREWPRHLLRGQRRRGLVRAAQCALVAGAAGAALLLAAMAAGSAGLLAPLLMLAVGHGIAQQLFLVVTTESRSAGDTLAYAWQQLVRGALTLAAGAALAWQGGTALGLLALELGVTLLAVGVIGRAVAARAGLQMSAALRVAARRLPRVPWRAALTLAGVMLLSFAAANVDRWLAAGQLDAAGFGVYAFAAILLSAGQAFQALVNAAGYPLVARRQATEGHAGAWRVSVRLSLLVIGSGSVLLLPLWGAADAAVARWFPAYAAAAPLLPWLALIAIVRAADFWTSFLVIAGHESMVLRLQGGSVSAAIAVWLGWRWWAAGATASPADFVVLAGLATAFGAAVTAVAARAVAIRENPRR